MQHVVLVGGWHTLLSFATVAGMKWSRQPISIVTDQPKIQHDEGQAAMNCSNLLYSPLQPKSDAEY